MINIQQTIIQYLTMVLQHTVPNTTSVVKAQTLYTAFHAAYVANNMQAKQNVDSWIDSRDISTTLPLVRYHRPTVGRNNQGTITDLKIHILEFIRSTLESAIAAKARGRAELKWMHRCNTVELRRLKLLDKVPRFLAYQAGLYLMDQPSSFIWYRTRPKILT